MEATIKNEETAREIINLFAKKGYTVDESLSVIRYVRSSIQRQSTVKRIDKKLFDVI